MLLDKASLKGYLTTDDLMEVYPDVNRDAERLDVIMLALRNRGVEIFDQNQSDQDEPEELEEEEAYSWKSQQLKGLNMLILIIID